MKIKLLCEILDSKKSILISIFNITENQQTMLLQPEKTHEIKIIFTQMNNEKQSLIDDVFKNYELFEKVFSSIRHIFEENSKLNKELILQLQEKIKLVSELDIDVRNAEKSLNNYALNEAKKRNMPITKSNNTTENLNKFNDEKNKLVLKTDVSKINNASTNYILNEYKRNINQWEN